jgi:hypothetical protein
MAYPTPQWVTDLLAAQASLVLAEDAIDGLTPGDPATVDEELYNALVNVIAAIKNLDPTAGKDLVPATPGIVV